jgi:hypothetical protein
VCGALTKCDAWDSKTRTVSWAFADNETKLVFNDYDEYMPGELTATHGKTESDFLEDGVIYTHNELSAIKI